MDVRYQVFISSTFTDLQEERAKVQKTIMQLDCIPAGMELFPAIDEEQFNFIKKVIDDSDYYLLIIGGRYGSIAPDGLSYTEKEYDYAVSKGIKIIALIHEKPGILPFDKSEQDAVSREKLEKFKIKASTNRVVLFWKESNELPAHVALSLPVTIKTYPAIGWVRANSVPDSNLYKEYIDLLKENERLKEETIKSKLNTPVGIADLNDYTTIRGAADSRDFFGDTDDKTEWSVNVTWGEIFNIISPRILIPTDEDSVGKILAYNLLDKVTPPIKVKSNKYSNGTSYTINQNDLEAIRFQLRALELILLTTKSYIMWKLSPSGEKLLVINKAIRKVPES